MELHGREADICGLDACDETCMITLDSGGRSRVHEITNRQWKV